jgi:amino acid adenylation domain-containing protein
VSDPTAPESVGRVAIIGMAGRFPGARDVREFWENLKASKESITHFTTDQLEVGDRERLALLDNYVAARGIVSDVDKFDATFFGIMPREAELTDPQHRLFLEACWHAFDDAGYDPLEGRSVVGVYAGASYNSYFLENVGSGRAYFDDYAAGFQVSNFTTTIASHAEFLATRVAYKLNLRGPAFSLGAGCATSLVAVSQACLALQNYQCDMALAGAVSITFPQRRGYLHEPGGMVSSDGHCRTFAAADGTVFGDGVGVVLLKRLEDAVADGDSIYAVILGCGINNDGSSKVGFTAPSVEGQARAIEMAHASAGVDPSTITYVEAHGTGTPLGDPVEVAALTRAFRTSTDKKNFCALGTAKTNVGHLDVAAGVTGLIKTAMSLHHRTLVPMLHFQRPNPRLDLENSPFYVQTELQEWNRGSAPLRAGVSAFGMGGTNTHLVLEQAPELERLPAQSRWKNHLLILSAKTEDALDRIGADLAGYLAEHSELDTTDVASTLMNGRHAFDVRRVAVCTDLLDAATSLGLQAPDKSLRRIARGPAPPVVFMFPGQGSQYVNMGGRLRELNPVFRDHFDRCAEIIRARGGPDLRALIYPSAGSAASAAIDDTACAQPGIFAIEYALVQMWLSLGIVPAMMIGHSVGEFVAACVASVMSLDDALALIVTRGRLMGSLPRGAMLSVRLGEARVRELLVRGLDIAAVNSPALTVVAGPLDAVERFEQLLAAQSVAYRRLATSHAFHSEMMEPIIPEFRAACRTVKFSTPLIPFISGVTGDWIAAQDATSADYWARHLRAPVRFSNGMARLRADPASLLEVGPGTTLTMLARQHSAPKQAVGSDQLIVNSMPAAHDLSNEESCLLNAVGRLWIHGAHPIWAHLYPGERRRRVSLPGYPFEPQSHWIARRADADAQPVQLKDASADASMPAVVPMPSTEIALIRSSLASIFQDLSGLDLAAIDPGTSFLELGFDSLFLTQVAQQLFSTFALKITFRQLLEQQSSLDALAAYVADRVPATVSSVREPTPVPTPSSATTPYAAASDLERMLQTQVAAISTMSDLFSRQLDALKGAAPASVAVPVAATQLPDDVAAPAPTRFRPISAGAAAATTPVQLDALDALISRYTIRTARSRDFTTAHRDVLADPRAAAGFRLQWKALVYPIVAARSRGSRIWDLDGNEYIDIVNGYGPIMLGHSPPFVIDAVAAQLRLGIETGPQTALAGEVAILIAEMTAMDRVTFCNTGSEAVIAAFRLARTVTGRDKIVVFNGDYHGMFDEVLVRGVGPLTARRSLPIAPGIPRAAADNIIVLDYGSEESLNFIRAHGAELAAVCVEPVQSRHPALVPVEFLRALRAITNVSSTALIFDEVVTGFRVHPGGCQALFGIRADLATYGKVIGGGMPIGVLAGSRIYMDALDGGAWSYDDQSYPTVGVTFFAGTFVRHPLVMAAARAVLLHLKNAGPALQQNLTAKTSDMVDELNAFLSSTGLPTRIETFASLAYFAWPPEYNFASLFYYWMRAKGIYIQESFPLFLTTAHSDADIAQIVRAFKESVGEMQAAGLLPFPATAAFDSDTPILPALLNGAAHRETSIPAASALTEAQCEVWLSASLSAAAGNAFNESFTLKLHGPLDSGALCKSLNQVIARHDALRAVFSEDGDSQNFASALEIEIPLVDLRALSTSERDARIAAILTEEASTALSLTRGPLIRARLLELADDDHHLIVTTHHIVCDGWSANVILDELSVLYAAALGANPVKLAPAMQFRDYVASQSLEQRSAAYRSTEDFWLAQFSKPVEPLSLPADRPRPAVKSFRGATCRRIVGADAYRRIKRAGAKNQCTLFATLLAGFQVLLARLSGQDDIVVGVPSAGQSSVTGGGNLVGHCVNFLPLRIQVDRIIPFAEFLATTRRAVLDAYEHQDYTYGTLVRKLQLPRDPSHLPLCEVQFNLERLGANLAFPKLSVEVAANAKAFVNFDLFVNVIELGAPGGLLIDCDYNTDLFDEASVIRWLGHFEVLLESFASGANLPISQMPLMNETERHQLLVDWNGTHVAYPTAALVHQLFEQQAARQPDAVAAVFGNSRITYAQLDARANQLANHLRANGAHDGDRVAIYLDRSLELPLAMLAVLKAGCVYVPLDPIYPDDRVQFILDQAGVRLLITQSNLAAALPSYSGARVLLDADAPNLFADGSLDAPQISRDSSDLADIIYTSGSTGRPKGVEVTHRSYVNLLLSIAREPGLTAADTLLAITTVAFDIAGLELMLPLAVGGRVVIASRVMTLEPALLLAEIERVGATVMQATPTTWRLLADSAAVPARPLRMLCGGETLPPDLAARLLGRPGELWNMYGPTETTIWSATSRIDRADAVTIGRPIANTQFYVLDAAGQPAPIGVAGELNIGGDGVARGYFKQPELTNARFVPDPFSSEPGARMYRTGDLVRQRASGRLEFIGRIDRQVKLRGYRIELPEIEARLLALEGIDDASVVLANDPSGEPWLVAYLVKSPGARGLDSAALRTALRISLPDYMIPSIFVTLDALPRTLNGKIDLKAMPPAKPDPITATNGRPEAAPLAAVLTADERAMRSIWQDVLGLDRLAVTDDIFALGGDSIRILQIVARARKAGFALNAMQIFEHRTIAAVARSASGRDQPLESPIELAN